MSRERTDWVDLAKGIAIILMVIGHTGIPEVASSVIGVPHLVRNWIYSFHMPLFFLLSGALTNWAYSYKEFVLHKSKTLLSYLILYSVINVLLLKISDTEFAEYSFIHVLQNGWGGFALWFLAVLYLSLLCARIFCNRYTLWAVSVCLVLGWGLAQYEIRLPWSLSTVPYATALILIGKRSSPYLCSLSKTGMAHKYALAATGFLLCTAVAYCYSQLDLCVNKILPLIPMLLGGVSGTLFICLLSLKLSTFTVAKKIMLPIGRNTLEIMAFSQVFLIAQRNLPIHGSLKYVLMAVCIYFMVCIRKTTSNYFIK